VELHEDVRAAVVKEKMKETAAEVSSLDLKSHYLVLATSKFEPVLSQLRQIHIVTRRIFINGSLSPKHGASSGCIWENDL
jgi:hypothetical protein